MNIKTTNIYFKMLAASTLVIAAILTIHLFVASSSKISSKDSSEHSQVVAFELPKSIEFAGEPLPLERTDIQESLDREITVNAYWHSQTIIWIKRANRFFPVIEPILKSQGVPDDFKYLALIESNFSPTATSPAGAVGIWQFIKETGKIYGLEVTAEVDERYHIEKSTVAACKYLKDAYAKFGNWTCAAASYNAGMAGVANQQTRQIEKDYYKLLWGEETGRYIFRIIAAKEILSNQAKYNFNIDSELLYKPYEYTEVEVNGAITSIANFAQTNGTTYKSIKILNPWLREPFLLNKLNKTYKIKIPKAE